MLASALLSAGAGASGARKEAQGGVALPKRPPVSGKIPGPGTAPAFAKPNLAWSIVLPFGISANGAGKELEAGGVPSRNPPKGYAAAWVYGTAKAACSARSE